MNAAGHFFGKQIVGMRQDGGDAGADVVTFDEGAMADSNAGDIGDGVKPAGPENPHLDA